MIEALTLDAPVRFAPDRIEFVGSIGGRPQRFAVDADVFKELLQVTHIGPASMKSLFCADPAHFLYVAARKLAQQGPSKSPIHLTLADLLH
ncbi:hypothetical protein [Caballeronia sp. AZ10_KS36]|uniref:hypothetical protein n=1 Tax=Caballeronia sp. AZ10_KS36 TaxID=2921757 RepID=UPI00202820ED|nr:hypothetical protein [Caballeronia sp. AZ10_KS36]